MERHRIAAVDVGSNALRLRIVEVRSGLGRTDEWREVLAVRAPVRLGYDVFTSGALSRETLDRAGRALRQFKDAMDDAGVTAYRAVATSATREAANGTSLVSRARREARLDLETIDGFEEARLVHVAVARRLRLVGRTAIVDIGGGSTDIAIRGGRGTSMRSSLPLGTVRLLAAWHPEGGPVGRRRLGVLEEVVERSLGEIALDLSTCDQIVATGGSIRSIAKLCGRDAPDASLSTSRIATLLERLRPMTEAERMRAFGLRADRADTIVPAAVVLGGVAAAAGASTILAPDVGIRDGILAELLAARASRPRSLVSAAKPREYA